MSLRTKEISLAGPGKMENKERFPLSRAIGDGYLSPYVQDKVLHFDLERALPSLDE
jgi:hypothetical protein